ncbi:hypothetical protein EV122DRAFT_181892, partial [Schizophyllum commune]
MGRRKVSNIAHLHRGTTHPNAGGRKAGKGEGSGSKKLRSTQDQVSPKRTLEETDAVIDLGKENQGPIKVPPKRRKIIKEPADIAPASGVTTWTQSTPIASHVPDPILLATAISEARQVAESVQALYLLPMPCPAVLQPRSYPA